MKIENITFTRHALQQMFIRSISVDEVKEVINRHDVVMEYPDDAPYPSMLLFGLVERRPLHVVLGYDAKNAYAHVITAYEPDSNLWEPDFRSRRR